MAKVVEKIPKKAVPVEPERLPISGIVWFIGRLTKNKLSLAGTILILLYVLIAILAPVLAPPPEGWRDPYMIPHEGYSPDPLPPSLKHPFGTTEQQFDIYYGVIWGTRTAFKVGLVVVGVALLIGILLGALAGYYGGRLDEGLMRMVDIFYAFPGLVLAVVVVAILGHGLEKVMIALIIVWWPTYARLLRGEVLSVKERDFVEAARALGESDWRIILRHILPNTIYPVLVVASLDMGAVVLVAAALSFLGLGAPTGYADWGQLASFSRQYIIGVAGDPFQYWYTLVFPGLAIFLFVLGWNLLGDAFRDILDPRLRGTM